MEWFLKEMKVADNWKCRWAWWESFVAVILLVNLREKEFNEEKESY